MREEAYKVTPDQLLAESALQPANDIWDLGYKSTSDEEDNDSDDEEDYGKITYPKARGQSTEKADTDKADTKASKVTPITEDVCYKLIQKDKGLLKRDLQARLDRVRYQ